MPDESIGVRSTADGPAASSGAMDSVVTAELVESVFADKVAAGSADDYYRPAKLTIAHLLMWITLAAIFMKVIGVFDEGGAAPAWSDAWVRAYVKAVMYSSAVLFTAGIVGTIVLLCGKLRGATGRLQPGHWLVAIVSANYLAQTLMSIIQLILVGSFLPTADQSTNSAMAVAWLLKGTVHAVTAVTSTWAAVKIRSNPLWSVAAVLLAMMAASGAFYEMVVARTFSDSSGHYGYAHAILYSIYALTSVPALILLSTAGLIDFTARRRRDGLHWLGAALAVSACAYTFVSWAVYLIATIQTRYT